MRVVRMKSELVSTKKKFRGASGFYSPSGRGSHHNINYICEGTYKPY